MDYSFSIPPIPEEDEDEPQTPPRSPSRLDFCIQDLDEDHDYESHSMYWNCASFPDEYPCAFIEEDTFAVAVATPDVPHPPLADPGQDDLPSATDSQSCQHIDVPPEHPTLHAVIEPRAPMPVRPPSVLFHLDDQEHVSPCRPAQQRLNYPHHGLSRSALLQQKSFWNSRHEEWVEWQSRMDQDEVQTSESGTDKAYSGLAISRPRVVKSPPPYVRTPPSGLERDLADHPPRTREQDVHASIYPRVGDISALRDPYSVNIDRCFFKYPLWTLHKTLYVFNMHQRAAPSPSVADAGVHTSTSSSTLSSYTTSASGDDEESDSTLVADNSPVSHGQTLVGQLKDASPPRTPPAWKRLCGWELSWYARWELLIGLFRRDALDISLELSPPPQSKATPPSPPERRIFRFTVGEDEDTDVDDEDEDEEDYGTLVSHSSFRVDFDEECERAMAFYNRTSACSGLVV